MSRKFVFLIVAALVFFVGFTAGQCTRSAMAADKEIQFAWDADVLDEVSFIPWQAIEIYQRDQGGAFDYNNPISVVPQTYEGNTSGPSITPKIAVSFPDGENTTFEFTARAKAMVGNELIYSGDAETADGKGFVSFNMNLLPIEDINFDVIFNDQTGTLDFVWGVTDDRITQWKVFSKVGEEEPFVELAQIDKEGDLSQISTSVPEGSLFPMGVLTTVSFAVVGISPHGESTTTITKPITRDRRTATGEVVNFKIILE